MTSDKKDHANIHWILFSLKLPAQGFRSGSGIKR